MKVPKSVGPGVTVKILVAVLKLMKAGKPVVPYKITETDSMQETSKEFTSK